MAEQCQVLSRTGAAAACTGASGLSRQRVVGVVDMFAGLRWFGHTDANALGDARRSQRRLWVSDVVGVAVVLEWLHVVPRERIRCILCVLKGRSGWQALSVRRFYTIGLLDLWRRAADAIAIRDDSSDLWLWWLVCGNALLKE